MITPREHDELIEAVASASRTRTPHGRIEPHPAWHDLDEAGRVEAYEAALIERLMEAALDERGLSATGHLVLRQIERP